MRALIVLLIAAALAGGEVEEPWLPPPADPGAGPLPAGLRLAFRQTRVRHVLGEPLDLALMVSAGNSPVQILGEEHYLSTALTLTRPDGTQQHQEASLPYVQSGMTRLAPGAVRTHSLYLSWQLRPRGPGRHVLSAFAELGWGPERPGDPRRVVCELECVNPAPAHVPGIVARALGADRDGRAQAYLHFPAYVAELRRLATGGSLRALEYLGAAPGRAATEALIAIALEPPVWHDLRDGEQPNLGFSLLSRLADHLPPRRLPHEEVWWEQPEAEWRRGMMAGVPRELLPSARTAALAWLQREPWGAAEVLVWAAQPEDRPALMEAITHHAEARDTSNHLHALWRLAYAVRLAEPEAPPPDPAAGFAEQMVWACHRVNAGTPSSAEDETWHRILLGSTDPLVRRLGVWSVPRPVSPSLIPDLVALFDDPTADAGVIDSLLWKLARCDDARVLDAFAAILADAERCRHLSDDLYTRLASRRVAAARALVVRARTSGRGDECLRGIARLCLSVRPVLSMRDHPTPDAWRKQADAWERWLDRHADRLGSGPIPAGDSAQPDHWLAPQWWFEAADGRRWFQPPPES